MKELYNIEQQCHEYLTEMRALDRQTKELKERQVVPLTPYIIFS